jgi:hypothetical protein
MLPTIETPSQSVRSFIQAEPEPIRVSVASLRNMSGERKYHANTFNAARRIAEASATRRRHWRRRNDRCWLWLGRLVARQHRRQDGERPVRRRGRSGAGARVRRQIPRPTRRRGEDRRAFEGRIVEASGRVPQGFREPSRRNVPEFCPCVRLLHAVAHAEVSCPQVREAWGTSLEEIMTINVLPDRVMRTVFLSLAAAIVVVFVGMLLLTTLHP